MNVIKFTSLKKKHVTFWVFNGLIPLLFFVGALWLMPVSEAFQFNTDEGIELMKAILYGQGFELYTQIWNEQPPLFTVLLWSWFKLFGESIVAARLLTLCFATLLIWAFAQTVRRTVGDREALIATIMLSFSCYFLQLSVSVMIGLPGLALAIVGIYCLQLYQQQPRPYLLILTGIFLGLSLQTKLITAFLIPIVILQLALINLKNKRWLGSIGHFVSASIWFLSACLIAFVVVGYLLDSLQNFGQLIQPNLGQNIEQAYFRENSFLEVLGMYLQDLDYVLLAIPGTILLLKQRQPRSWLPLFWVITITIVLVNHKPLWTHYYLLLSVPITWLAAYGIKEALHFFQQVNWQSQFKLSHFKRPSLSLLTATFLILVGLATPLKLTYIQLTNYHYVKESEANFEVVQSLLKYDSPNQWVFTDLPIYGFYAGLKVPPEIAVFAKKRWLTGNLTIRELRSVLKTYRPEQIVLGRIPEVKSQLRNELQANYAQIYERDGLTHYVSKALTQMGDEGLEPPTSSV